MHFQRAKVDIQSNFVVLNIPIITNIKEFSQNDNHNESQSPIVMQSKLINEASKSGKKSPIKPKLFKININKNFWSS